MQFLYLTIANIKILPNYSLNTFMSEIIKAPESRKVEFKETLPSGDKLEKTVVAFSNDAGGEIYIGIKDHPREITGVPEETIFQLEEQISALIHEHCYPTVLPDIVVQKMGDKYVLIVKIPRGSLPPYYIKSAGKEKGTYIRVGSSNRAAGREIIEELERRRRNISFDSTAVYDLSPDETDLKSFINNYEELTGKKINSSALAKLGLIKTENGKDYPTVAAVLLSDGECKTTTFPYAKIECARFIGTKTAQTLDSLTISESVCLQPDSAMAFIKRNIRKSSKIGLLYREERWEYPLPAIRELIVNAVVHRDYSLTGKDIKIAIFDDMLEITSPGNIPPSIDITDLTSGQSEIRNKTLAPIFKELRLIEQWGTGFQKLTDELKNYPEIRLQINQPGLSFQVQLIKKDYKPDYNPEPEGKIISKVKEKPVIYKTNKTYKAISEELSMYLTGTPHAVKVLEFCDDFKSRNQIQEHLGLSDREHFRKRILVPMLDFGLLRMFSPDKPQSSVQKYKISEKGRIVLQLLYGKQQ